MDKVPLSRRRRVQALQPSTPDCSFQIINVLPSGLYHQSFCCQCVNHSLQSTSKTRRLGSIERSCVESADSWFLPRFLVGFTKSRPRFGLWTRQNRNYRVYAGCHRRNTLLSSHTRANVFFDSQIFMRIAKQKLEAFWEVLNLLLYWRIGCTFVNWFHIHRSSIKISIQSSSIR